LEKDYDVFAVGRERVFIVVSVKSRVEENYDFDVNGYKTEALSGFGGEHIFYLRDF
jgi:hypothetical protein